ncbi:recombinase family protein [Novosphingobium album (ex Liu et al. 2023)]|uniref:Recombinase family protein n=1 Tax=Novosphingobium album (ex Liu et al. 2023) TaxID=3031130 RepID=A0ABT5WTW3_9SPHN|nr:recombinase family protein [Novosphingobium album (ex Liu et al. 2023)]MDE8653327.1 recombinase family protein [Novosphingobium album (ex Liu et al. 2023)]
MTDTHNNQLAVIYCRVSDPKQKTDGHGLESQETTCREYAARHGYDVVRVFHDDFTGAHSNRPAMKEMLKFLRSQKQTYVVIIDDLSRLARDVVAHAQLREAVKKVGAIMASPSHQFREDSDGRFVENVLASSYQHQREKNAEQTLKRMRARCLDGYWVFQQPVGYKFAEINDSRGKNKILVRNEPLASIVAEALQGYATGRFQTQAEVIRFLEDQPEFPRNWRGQVHPQRVYELLNQVLYAGHLEVPRWNVSLRPAQHEGLIDYETFQKIQTRLSGLAKVPARKNLGEDFALRGFVICGQCETRLTSYWAKGRHKHYPYYHCPNKECPDYGKAVARDKIEGEFADILQSMRPSHDMFVLAYETFGRLWEARSSDIQTRKKGWETEVRKIETQIVQLIDRAMEAESQPLVKAYEGRIHGLESRKAVARRLRSPVGVNFDGR